MRHDMSHTDVTDASSIVREAYTTHGLSLNSLSKKRLTQLIAERFVGVRYKQYSCYNPC
jgi:hypothetical protein